jgi:DNA polymerase III alpha subunit (gram-positive type)
MKEELLRFKRFQKYIILDCETEGLNLVHSKPWQCSWIIAEGNKIISKHDRYIHWDFLNVSPDAARITGFCKNDYARRAEDPLVVWQDLSRYLLDPQYIVIGQNLLGFDVYMLNVWLKNIGLESDYSYIPRVIDTKSLAAAIFKNIIIPKEDLISWQYKLLNHREKGMKTSQAHLLKHYNIPHDPKQLHNALYDVEMTFQIFLKQIYDIEV